jgi:hypothetical protein
MQATAIGGNIGGNNNELWKYSENYHHPPQGHQSRLLPN